MSGKHIANYAGGEANVTIRHDRPTELFVQTMNQYDTAARSANCSEGREATSKTHTAGINRTSSSRDATPAAPLRRSPELTLLPGRP